MAICALGYIGIRSDRMDDWSEFASKLIDFQSLGDASDNNGNSGNIDIREPHHLRPAIVDL